jgi:hypothetical protein
MNIQYLHSIEANQMVMEPVLVLDRFSGHFWLCDALRLCRAIDRV